MEPNYDAVIQRARDLVRVYREKSPDRPAVSSSAATRAATPDSHISRVTAALERASSTLEQVKSIPPHTPRTSVPPQYLLQNYSSAAVLPEAPQTRAQVHHPLPPHVPSSPPAAAVPQSMSFSPPSALYERSVPADYCIESSSSSDRDLDLLGSHATRRPAVPTARRRESASTDAMNSIVQLCHTPVPVVKQKLVEKRPRFNPQPQPSRAAAAAAAAAEPHSQPSSKRPDGTKSKVSIAPPHADLSSNAAPQAFPDRSPHRQPLALAAEQAARAAVSLRLEARRSSASGEAAHADFAAGPIDLLPSHRNSRKTDATEFGSPARTAKWDRDRRGIFGSGVVTASAHKTADFNVSGLVSPSGLIAAQLDKRSRGAARASAEDALPIAVALTGAARASAFAQPRANEQHLTYHRNPNNEPSDHGCAPPRSHADTAGYESTVRYDSFQTGHRGDASRTSTMEIANGRSYGGSNGGSSAFPSEFPSVDRTEWPIQKRSFSHFGSYPYAHGTTAEQHKQPDRWAPHSTAERFRSATTSSHAAAPAAQPPVDSSTSFSSMEGLWSSTSLVNSAVDTEGRHLGAAHRSTVEGADAHSHRTSSSHPQATHHSSGHRLAMQVSHHDFGARNDALDTYQQPVTPPRHAERQKNVLASPDSPGIFLEDSPAKAAAIVATYTGRKISRPAPVDFHSSSKPRPKNAILRVPPVHHCHPHLTTRGTEMDAVGHSLDEITPPPRPNTTAPQPSPRYVASPTLQLEDYGVCDLVSPALFSDDAARASPPLDGPSASKVAPITAPTKRFTRSASPSIKSARRSQSRGPSTSPIPPPQRRHAPSASRAEVSPPAVLKLRRGVAATASAASGGDTPTNLPRATYVPQEALVSDELRERSASGVTMASPSPSRSDVVSPVRSDASPSRVLAEPRGGVILADFSADDLDRAVASIRAAMGERSASPAALSPGSSAASPYAPPPMPTSVEPIIKPAASQSLPLAVSSEAAFASQSATSVPLTQPAEQLVKFCRSCGQANPNLYCGNCGTPTILMCNDCGALVTASRICKACSSRHLTLPTVSATKDAEKRSQTRSLPRSHGSRRSTSMLRASVGSPRPPIAPAVAEAALGTLARGIRVSVRVGATAFVSVILRLSSHLHHLRLTPIISSEQSPLNSVPVQEIDGIALGHPSITKRNPRYPLWPRVRHRKSFGHHIDTPIYTFTLVMGNGMLDFSCTDIQSMIVLVCGIGALCTLQLDPSTSLSPGYALWAVSLWRLVTSASFCPRRKRKSTRNAHKLNQVGEAIDVSQRDINTVKRRQRPQQTRPRSSTPLAFQVANRVVDPPEVLEMRPVSLLDAAPLEPAPTPPPAPLDKAPQKRRSRSGSLVGSFLARFRSSSNASNSSSRQR